MARLDRYLEMRDFGATPEPQGQSSATGLALRYGVQWHDATRKHFDLRLEWDGALLSWAVTRGPSLNVKDKRLAVRTEDHPLDYLGFEGTIPKGNYGAGTVMLWDIGYWQPLDPVGKGLKKGHLSFRLHGHRLTGNWHLVRMNTGEKRENWLLIKQDDEAAGKRDPVARYVRSVATNRTMREITSDAAPVVHERAGKLPGFLRPQLATTSDDMVDGDAWWHELKFDGYRALAALGKGGPRIYTRSGLDWSDRFASLLDGFAEADCDSALIDGEIVAGAGLQGFSTLQQAIKQGGPFSFYAFDLLSVDGKDLTSKPLAERRKQLEKVIKPVPPLGQVQLSPLIENDATGTFDAICKAGGEGLIAKRTAAAYRHVRTKDWLKIKCRRRDEFVIVGWQKSDKKSRAFASLALGVHRKGQLEYVGKVGTGFDDGQMAEIADELTSRARKTAPVNAERSEVRSVRWVAPELVAEVEYAEMTADGRLRHAVFKGLREDKPARTVELEPETMSDNTPVVSGISISSPERAVYPDEGITKLEVARYYDQVADRLLSTAADHPLSLVRLPEGLSGERFFQKHATKGFPDAIKSVDVTESDGNTEPYMYVTSARGLVGAAQMGTLEFHIWGSRIDDLESPDRLVFDLDPDEGLGWSDVVSAAYDLRDRLEDLGVGTWPLLSGGKGIHVVAPLRRIAEWDTAKLYAQVFAKFMAQTEPKRFTADMSKAKRKGRIFIDWLRNERGATAIAPFSLRARPGAPVAVPVNWDELKSVKSPQAYSIASALERDWRDVNVPNPIGLTHARIDKLEKAVSDANG